MQVSVVRRVDDNGFYIEDQYHYVAETLDEARQLGYPIVKQVVPNESPDIIEDPANLKDLRQVRDSLTALPASPIRDAMLTPVELEIQQIEENLEFLRQANSTIEVEDFIVPPLPANLIVDEVPQDVPFWLPRWDGSKWVEGLTADEIQAKIDAIPKQPDWDGFVAELLGSDIDEAIAESTDKRNLNRLDVALSRRPSVGIEELILFWNSVIAALPKPLTKAQVKSLSTALGKFNIPLTADTAGVLAVKV